jgi:hypothetical protein
MDEFVLVGAACAAFGGAYLVFRNVRSRWFRARGRRVERRSIESLRLPRGWTVEANVPVPGLGLCDCLITTPKSRRFAVELKSSESAKKVWFRLFTKDEIRRGVGQKFPRNFVVQALAVASRLDAEPILWMPLARRRSSFRTASGVLVVQGGRKALEKAIGARLGFLWF